MGVYNQEWELQKIVERVPSGGLACHFTEVIGNRLSILCRNLKAGYYVGS